MEINLSKYERFFEVKGGSFLIASLYFNYYKNLGAIVINKNRVMSVFLEKKYTNKTRINGKNFIMSEKKVINYCKSFSDFIDSSNVELSKITTQKVISTDDIDYFFNLIYKFFDFYKMTEFFYTDKAYDKTIKEKLHKNTRLMENMKNKGRILLNSILLGSNSYLEKMLKKFQYNKLLDLHFFSPEEIINKKTDIKLLKTRYENYILINNREYPYKLSDVLITTNEKNGNSLRGVVACRGMVRGFARVIEPNYDNYDKLAIDIDEMKKGEILISESTSPDLFAAFEKSAAVVTNQGGMGSHAATLSRELGIPCIVGTEKATKIIKTGFLIEVNANEGYVKVIKKI